MTDGIHSRIKGCESLKKELDLERNYFDDYAQELALSIDPRRGDFFESDSKERGRRKDQKFINNTVLKARRICVSGMIAGTSSPSKPWFKLETVDRQLMRSGNVREWAHEVENTVKTILNESKFYRAINKFLTELTTFSTAVVVQEDDFDSVVRFKVPTWGTFWLGYDHRDNLSVFILETKMFARQLAGEFGKENLPDEIQKEIDNGSSEARHAVTQCIELNPDFDEDKLESRFKRYRSIKYLSKHTSHPPLSERGFDQMPAFAVRWETVGEEAYGTGGPGMVALGDNNGLQEQERIKAKGVARTVSPLLKGPPGLKNLNNKNLTSGLIAYDDNANREGLQPVFTVDQRLGELREDMAATERRIDEAFFVDLFQTISSLEGIQPRNELELTSRNQESLTVLGPVLEAIQTDLLTGVLQRIYNRADEAGLLPPLPPELEGGSLEIRFIGSLAQAQRSSDAANIIDFANVVGALVGAGFEAAKDKLDVDATIDNYSQFTGVVPDVVVSSEEAQQTREGRAQLQAEAAQLEAQNQQASANVQNASAAKMVNEIE